MLKYLEGAEGKHPLAPPLYIVVEVLVVVVVREVLLLLECDVPLPKRTEDEIMWAVMTESINYVEQDKAICIHLCFVV